jgi:hypothetical protein
MIGGMNSRVGVVVVIALLILSAGYVLSAGPALWLVHRERLPYWVMTIYEPIIDAPLLGEFIRWERNLLP